MIKALFRRGIGAALSLTLSGLVAVAQPAAPAALDPRTVEVDAQGKCDAAVLARLPGLNENYLVKGLGFTYVLGEAAVRRTVNPQSSEIATQPGVFERVVIYARDAQSKSLLVGFKNRAHCGWVNPTALLYEPDAPTSAYNLGPKPVQVQKGPDGHLNPGNDLDLKVVLQNLKRDGEDGAPILGKPGDSTRAQGLKRLKLFYVFEVFRWQKAPDPDKNNEARIYYLVGRSGEDGKMEGWVHEDDVYTWNSRVAAFWGRTGEARGFASKELLTGDQFAIKEPARLTEPENRTVQRFPVIDQSPSTAEIIRRRRAAAPGAIIDSLIDHYRIATPACAQPRGGATPQPGAPQQSEECTSQDVDDVTNRANKFKNIDVMFVMDATKSMEPYFPAARRALEKFIDQLLAEQTEGDINIRVAVHIYGDYKTNEVSARAIDYTIMIPFKDLKLIKPDFARLDNLKMFDDVHRDRPEASFAALIRGGGNTSWSPEAGIRYIVHIGDHGNRSPGAASVAPGKLVELFTEDEVAKELVPKGIIYVGIPVLGTYDATHNDAFVRQARRLRELMPRQSAEVTPTYTASAQQESEETRVNAVLRALQSGVQISRSARERIAAAIECAQNPQSAVCVRASQRPAGASGWQAEVVAGLQERHGLTQEVINRVYGRSQTVGTFYFKPLATQGRQMFNFYIAMEDGPLRQMTKVAGELCDHVDKSDGARFLRTAIGQALDTAVDSQSVADLMQAKLFVPAIHLNELLLKPFNEMEDQLRQYRGTERMEPIKQRFCKSARLLQWASENKRVRDINADLTWDASQKTWRATETRALRDYNWKHIGGTGVPLYYIPIEFLPN